MAGALPKTSLGELTAFPGPPSRILRVLLLREGRGGEEEGKGGGRGKRVREEKGMAERGIGKQDKADTQLHWLPIRERILYKTALLAFKTRLASSPPYLADLLQL